MNGLAPKEWKTPMGEWLVANEWGQLLAPAGTGATGKAMGIGIKINSETNTALQPTRLRYAAELWRWADERQYEDADSRSG